MPCLVGFYLAHWKFGSPGTDLNDARFTYLDATLDEVCVTGCKSTKKIRCHKIGVLAWLSGVVDREQCSRPKRQAQLGQAWLAITVWLCCTLGFVVPLKNILKKFVDKVHRPEPLDTGAFWERTISSRVRFRLGIAEPSPLPRNSILSKTSKRYISGVTWTSRKCQRQLVHNSGFHCNLYPTSRSFTIFYRAIESNRHPSWSSHPLWPYPPASLSLWQHTVLF